MSILSRIKEKFLYYWLSPEQWGRHLGATIGQNNMLSKDIWSTEPYLVTIGNHCQLTNCKIHTHGGGQAVRCLDPTFDCFGKVTLGDYVYVGSGAMIMPGVSLGDHTLVAAGSIVTKSQVGGVVLAGNPAKVICTIEEYYEKNKKYNVSTKGMPPKEKKKMLMEMDENKFIRK